MAFTSLANRISTMPLLLCGPVLRRVEKNEVTVWVALKVEKKVFLEVYENLGAPNKKTILAGNRKTIRVGEHLHLVAVTATLLPLGTHMTADKIYYYNLFFSDPTATAPGSSDPGLLNPGLSPFEIHYAHEPEDLDPTHTSHFHLPSFCLAPQDLNKLRIVHGSCRKAHAEGIDAMPGIDEMIKSDRFTPEKRPHYLFLTGDQFYADDISRIMLYLLMDAEKSLFGSVEDLPLLGQAPKLPDENGENGFFFAGERKDKGGFTSHESNHLATAGEYMSYYLFMWSDIVWMGMGDDDFPAFKTIGGSMSSYSADKASLIKFRSGLAKVKRAMANVPTYMIFDDHDVTDDWYMTHHWCDNVLNNQLGRRMVMNGLLSYALFQDWGNKPAEYIDQQPATKSGTRLLAVTEKWFGLPASRRINSSVGFSTSDEPEIQKYLGLPAGITTADIFRPELDYFVINQQDPDAIIWYYDIQRENYEIKFLDGRTRRGYPDPKKGSGKGIDHADIISDQSLEKQIGSDGSSLKELTIIIAPTSLIAIPAIELEEFPFFAELAAESAFTDKYELDVYDHWKNQGRTAEKMLSFLSQRNAAGVNETLFKKHSRILILTGDVHFSAASRMQYEHPVHKALFAQIISSSFKKQDYKTRLLHQMGYKFGNVSALVLGDFFIARLPEKLEKLANDNNIFYKILGVALLLLLIWPLIILHITFIILDRLLQTLDQTILKDWFNEKGAEPRHFLGWKDPKAKEGIDKLTLPVDTTATPPKFQEIKLGAPHVISKKVLDDVIGAKPKFPDWQYRIDFIYAANDVREAAINSGIQPLTAPGPGDRKAALAQYLVLAKNHIEYTKNWGNGKEIVGVNNISEVFFIWTPNNKSISQETWWRLPGAGGQTLELFPLSRYKVSMNFDDPEYKVPPFPVP